MVFNRFKKNSLEKKALKLYNQGKYQEALECYDKIIETDPNNVKAWLEKGNIFAELKEYENALNCFDKVIKLDPKSVNGWYNKGIVLGKLGNRFDAIECFDKVLEIDNKKKEAWYNKGLNLALTRNYQEAEKCFDKALELGPNYEIALNAKRMIPLRRKEGSSNKLKVHNKNENKDIQTKFL